MNQKKSFLKKTWVQRVLFLIQAAAAGCLCFCSLNLVFLSNEVGGLREAAAEYMDTAMFFRRVDTVLEHKIRGKQNQELFETDGVFDGEKRIDIRSFGQKNVMVQDLNTTYRLEDLIRFYESGGEPLLREAILSALGSASPGREAGEILGEQSADLETILPVTEISLAECSKWYTNPSDFLLEMYQKLEEVSDTIGTRYAEYCSVQDETWAEDAPSNLRYFINNLDGDTYFTNIDVKTYADARKELEDDYDFDILFEGERSHNIMTPSEEYVLSDAAIEWFQNERFLSSNEQVLIAVDPELRVGDEIQEASHSFERYGELMTVLAVLWWVSAVVLGICFILSLAGVKPKLSRIPSELAVAGYLVIILIYFLLIPKRGIIQGPLPRRQRLVLSVMGAGGYLLFLTAVKNIWSRVRYHTFWSESITRMLVRSWKRVTSTRLLSGRFLVGYVGFFAVNIALLILFGQDGVIPVFILDMMGLLYLLRDLVGRQNVYEGIHQISRGDLEYKIDTTTLQGETLEMAKAINEMGDGLQEAVESMLRNERLKSELITNVSHDLKTPLTSIVNYVDLLKRENPSGEKTREYIEILDQKSQRLKQLTEDLVEASRIQSGNISLEMVRLPFGELLEQAIGEFQDRFEECGVSVLRKISKEPLFIEADGSQLWRVIENLMGNVCKYAKSGSTLEIRLYRDGTDVFLVLENESAREIEAPAEELTGRFVRGDRSRHTEGSGLGLSIAGSLTELMGGQLKIETEGMIFRAILSFPGV